MAPDVQQHNAIAGSVCSIPERRRYSDAKGFAWLIGGLIICPCHLPLTFALLGVALSGTAAGALLASHRYIAGLIIAVLWVIAMWRGFRHFGRANARPTAAPQQ